MNGLLLAAALLLAAPQANDPEEARRLSYEAFDRHAELNLESEFALLRAARDADLANLPIHLEYIPTVISRAPNALEKLRAEYEALPDSPLIRCLRAYVSVSQENLPAATPDLQEMEEAGEGGSCPTVLLALIAGDLKPTRTWEGKRLEYLERALALEPGLPGLWTSYASALAAAGRLSEAEDVLRRAAAAAWVHPLQRIRLNMRRAGLMRSRGDTVSANALWRAVQIAVERDGRPGMRLTYLRELGNVLGTENTPDNQLDNALRESAELASQFASWVYEWLGRYTLAMRLTDRGEPSAALSEYDRVVELADSVGIPRYQIRSYYKRGKALERLGRLAEAEADLLQALAVGAHVESEYLLAEVYHNLFHLYEAAGQQREAEQAVDGFVETVRPLYHSPLRMTAWLDAGEFRWKAGWHAAADQAYAAMVAVIEEQDEHHVYAGEYYERIGDLERARDYFRRGVAASGKSALSVRSLNLAGLTRVFLAMGQPDSAEVTAREHDSAITGSTDTPLLPEMLYLQGEHEEAIQVAEEWAGHRSTGGSAEAVSVAYLKLADLLIRSDEPARALASLHGADSLARAMNLTEQHIEALRLRGLALAAIGDTAGALKVLGQAADSSLRHSTVINVRDTQVALADLLASIGQLEPALDAYSRAAKRLETTTSSLDVDFDRVRHRSSNLEPYDGAIAAILAAPDRADWNLELLRWSARRKAAALKGATLGLASNAGNRWADTEVEVVAEGHAFVDYLVSGNLATALVLRGDRLSLHRLPLPSDSISSLTTRLRAPLTATFGGRLDLARARFDVAAAHELYRALWEPIVKALGGTDRVVIAPDGPLHLVPFVALVSAVEEGEPGRFAASRFVLDDYDIEYVPSARYLGKGDPQKHSTDGPGRLLAVAHDAPGADAEVRSISKVWPEGSVRMVTAGSATESAVRAIEGGYEVVHYATHAVANDRDPLASYIGLGADAGADGLYHLSEIAGQPRDQELVVLSGCETQTGELYAGEGLMGLTRAFLVSGARAVVATQWPVGEATASLMGDFYGQLAVGDDPSSALRVAQQRMRSVPETSHPFYWAGFVLHRRD